MSVAPTGQRTAAAPRRGVPGVVIGPPRVVPPTEERPARLPDRRSRVKTLLLELARAVSLGGVGYWTGPMPLNAGELIARHGAPAEEEVL